MRRKIVIGVDARPLSDNRVTGIARYSFEVLSRLVGKDFYWRFYSHKPLCTGCWDFPYVQIKCSNLSSKYMRMIWSQTVLPFWINRDADLFLSLTPRLPFLFDKNIPSVITVHDLVWRHAPQTMIPLSRFLDSILMPYATQKSQAIITVSESTKADILYELPHTNSSCIFPVHLGASKFNSISSNIIRHTSPYFLFIGTLEPRKNLSRLLEAFSLIDNFSRKGYKLLISGGDGWGNVSIDSLIKKYQLFDSVQFLGYQSDDELSNLYRNASFLVLPSLYEGFGLPLVEAMKYGVPLITSNLSSMPEIAGDAAIYVNPYSVDSIRSAILALINDESLRIKLSLNSLRRSHLYDWDATALSIYNVIDNVIKSKFV